VKRSLPVRAIVCLLALVFAAAPAMAQPKTEKTPLQAYQDFQAGVKKATTLEQTYPFLSAEYVAMLKSRPAADQKTWLDRLKDSATKTGVAITKTTITGDKCLLEATAKNPAGESFKGKISLVKEGGSWKLDEQGWGMTK